jgi:acetyltransferase-like isoleucine patch superfamily enzyme
MITDTYFSDAFGELGDDELEQYHKTVFMNMNSPLAERMRVEYYRNLFREMGDDVKIGCGVKIVHPQNISLGNKVTIHDNCVLIANSSKGISIGNEVTLKHGVYLDTEVPDTGYIEIGNSVYIGTGCCLHGHVGLEIGDFTLMAQNITITPFSHKFANRDDLIWHQGGHSRKVSIGRDCYIGMSCSILYSADIMDGSVIGSGSVVVKTIPPYSVAVGVPARVIKKRGD